jgi:hypothetical protein
MRALLLPPRAEKKKKKKKKRRIKKPVGLRAALFFCHLPVL